jgi:fructokinase
LANKPVTPTNGESMTNRFTIIGLGEALFDIFVADDRRLLGGAPLNVAVQAQQAAVEIGGEGVVLTRVGDDDLGQEIVADLARRAMTADHVQRDPDRPTGRVFVTVRDGEPHYEIVEGVAWDKLELDAAARDLAASCHAVCFGSLAQRDPIARASVQGFVRQARAAVRMFDVNLRQSYYDTTVLRESCELATAVKLNEHELPIVAEELGLAADGEQLRRAFDLSLVAYTRGSRGTVLFTPDGRFEDRPVQYDPHPQADGVGAGDACSAGLLIGMVLDWPWERTLNLANHLGAFVASQPGATPALPDELRSMARD